MASKTDISNRALSKLGEKRVSNVDTDDKDAAKVIRYMWENVRDALITSYPWNFAIKRKQLAASGDTPAWGYGKQYLLPADFLALLEIKGQPEFKLEGGYILTDDGSPIYIRYISRITDTGSFDALFNEALAAKLAVEACEEITQSNTKKQILLREYEAAIKEAYASDAIQEYPQKLTDDEWILARFSGYSDDIDYNA